MAKPLVSLADAGSALSHLHFAVKQEFEGIAVWGVEIEYSPYPGLGIAVIVECRSRYSQLVADRFSHGILNGPYDYRFEHVSREMNDDPDHYVKVTAYPDLQHEAKQHGS